MELEKFKKNSHNTDVVWPASSMASTIFSLHKWDGNGICCIFIINTDSHTYGNL